MKLTALFCTALFTLALGGSSIVSAQEPTQPPPPGGERPKMKMDFLTPEEQAKLDAARKKAMESDPSIKAEFEAMKQQREAAKDSGVKPTPEERKARMEKRRALEDKVHAAMLKADPTIGPILDKVAAHRKEMMKKVREHRGAQGASGQNTPGTALAPTTN